MIDTAQLASALSAVKPAVTGQRTFVKLDGTGEHLSVEADNADLGIRSVVDVTGTNLDAAPLVPHRPLAEFIAKAESPDVNVKLDGDMLVVTDGNASLSLATIADAWFPTRLEPEGDPIELDAARWDRIVGLVQFCATDSAKGIYTGVHFDQDGAVATDTFMLASVEGDFGLGATIPGAIVKAVGDDHDSVTVRTGSQVTIEAGRTTFSTSPLGGEYPDWRRLIPDDHATRITVGCDRFCRAVDRAALLGVDSPSKLGRHVRITPGDGTMTIQSIPDDSKGDSRSRVTEVIDAEVDGDWGWEFGLASGAVNALRAILAKPETITFRTDGPGRALIVRTDDVACLVQPIRIAS